MSHTVAAELRTTSGKGAARKMRALGRVPANINGPGAASTSISLDPTPLSDIYRKTRNANTVVTLDLGSEQVQVLIKEAQRHPLSRAILHVDFHRVDSDTMVEVDVPVRGVGRPAGAAIGGQLDTLRRTIKVRCGALAIPEAIEVDVTPLDVGQVIRVHQIPPLEGVAIVSDRNLPVLACVGKKK